MIKVLQILKEYFQVIIPSQYTISYQTHSIDEDKAYQQTESNTEHLDLKNGAD